jgi:hypothetical protein
LIQHAIYCVPRRDSGYTTDDNARALRLCTRLWGRRPERRMLRRVTGFLSFLEYARRPGGGFHNFLSYQRSWFDIEATDDCQGQAIRALAEVLGSGLPDDYRALARELIDAILPTLAGLRSIRAQAYLVLAWGHLAAAEVSNIDRFENIAWCAAQRLVESYQQSNRPGWSWFEPWLTYGNAVLPHALFVAARCWPNETYLDVATKSFAFLVGETTVENVFWPVGNAGWYAHGRDKAAYDQQPVEAITMADAAQAAFSMLADERSALAFRRAHDWFHGRNSLRLPLADTTRGACYDGLQSAGVNRNQGAESTLSYLGTELLQLETGRSAFELSHTH